MVVRTQLHLILAAMTSLVLACGEDTSVAPANTQGEIVQEPQGDTQDPGPDTGIALDVVVDDALDTSPPSGPLQITAQVTWVAWSTEVRPAPARFAMALADGLLLLQDEAGNLTLTESPVLETSLTPALPEVGAGVAIGESALLLATAEGLHGYVEDMLAPSPMNTILEATVHAMVYEGEGDRLWLASDEALMLHDGATLYALHPAELPTANAQLCRGGSIDGQTAVWVASGPSIYGLRESGDSLEVGAWVEGVNAIDLACDGEGRVWVVADDGDLYRRNQGGSWDWLRLPSAVHAIEAHVDHGALWIETVDGLWRHEGELFGPVDGATSGPWLTVDDAGTLVVDGPEGVTRVGVGDEPLPPPPPTWSEDIHPLSDSQCLLCHGPGALGANQMYTKEQWVTRIDDILTMVSSGAMPLPPNPPLDAATILRIQAWKDAGFPD